MASLYRRPNSPFWWVKWRDPDTGKIRRESTRFRVGLGTDRRAAVKHRDQLSLRETKLSGSSRKENFENWLPTFIAVKYKGRSLEKAATVWRTMAAFLKPKQIFHPAAFRRETAIEFVEWRKSSGGVRTNTALMELAYFSSCMSEAVRRGYISFNPCFRLGIKKESVRVKPEITDAEIRQIREGIAAITSNEPLLAALRDLYRRTDDPSNFGAFDIHGFFHASFEIAIHQGCRLSETYIDLFADVDLEQQLITFHSKGDKFYTVPLNPGLIPIIQELRKKRRTSYTIPKQTGPFPFPRIAAFFWSEFFKHHGLRHLSFHCTRVSCISRLHRKGVPETVAMQLVNHSTTLIHRLYRRFLPSELRSAWPQLPASGDTPSGSETPDAPPAI